MNPASDEKGDKPAILLAAHGCHDGSAANARVRDLAAAVAARLPGRQVFACFNLGTPRFCDVLDGVEGPRAVVVPLMASAGYFPTQRLPEELAKNASFGEFDLRTTPPLGTLDEVKRAAAARAFALAKEFGFDPSRTTILVIGHGTNRNPQSGRTTLDVAELIRAALPAADASAAFLDQDPLLEGVGPSLTRPNVIVAPYLFGGGGHMNDDIPERLGLVGIEPNRRADGVQIFEGDGRTYVIDRPFSDSPDVVELILHLVAPPREALRLGTRTSPLALWQAERVAAAFAAAGRAVEVVEMDTAGDADLSTPLDRFPTDGPFTDALEFALVAGRIDLAMHSLKDLPLAGPEELKVAAVLPRGPAGEALVSTDGKTLADLPPGAVVGTCSARRVGQLLRLRPDLRIRDIRGTVQARVRQVEDGKFDACILAIAGLERSGLGGKITQRFTADELLGEAGQGAIAVQCRAADADALAACAAVNHNATMLAITAERAFMELVESREGHPHAAAHAEVAEDGTITLTARVIEGDRTCSPLVTLRGDDAAVVARDAARSVVAWASRRAAFSSALRSPP